MASIKQMRGTEQDWLASTIILEDGQLGYDTTNNILKMGNGINLFKDLVSIDTKCDCPTILDGNNKIIESLLPDIFFELLNKINEMEDDITYILENPVIHVTSITLNKTSISDGATTQLIATVLPSDATNKTVTWTSSDTTIAEVSSVGVVTIKKEGSAIISCISNDEPTIIATCNVIVIPVTGITISPTIKTIEKGTTFYVTGTIIPNNATNKTITYSSSNTNIATVNSTTGLVTGVNVGSCTITATSSNGGYQADCSLTVNINVIGVSVDITNKTINTGETFFISPTITPSDATNKTVTWTSSNTNIATVTSSGMVTGINNGNCTITCTTQDGNKTATCNLTVNILITGISLNYTSYELSVGGNIQLTPTITPSNATNKTLTWTSSNTSIAVVTSTGYVHTKSSGNVTITCTANDGSGLESTCNIIVNVLPSSITLNQTSLGGVSNGETFQLTATVLPANATNKTVTWTSNNTNVATVNTTGLVTGKNWGDTSIVAATHNGLTASCSLHTWDWNKDTLYTNVRRFNNMDSLYYIMYTDEDITQDTYSVYSTGQPMWTLGHKMIHPDTWSSKYETSMYLYITANIYAPWGLIGYTTPTVQFRSNNPSSVTGYQAGYTQYNEFVITFSSQDIPNTGTYYIDFIYNNIVRTSMRLIIPARHVNFYNEFVARHPTYRYFS